MFVPPQYSQLKIEPQVRESTNRFKYMTYSYCMETIKQGKNSNHFKSYFLPKESVIKV